MANGISGGGTQMTAEAATTAIPGRLAATLADRRRARVDVAMRALSLVGAVVCLVPLAAIIAFVVINGAAGLDLDLLTKPRRALGIGGGALGAILGSLQLVALATLVAMPVGVGAAIYVTEFGGQRVARGVRFVADVLAGVPSILVGIFVFTFLVLPFRQFNAFAGAIALAVLMFPVIMRATEEFVRLVPGSIREASLALGIPVWRTVVSVVIRTAMPGIVTGILLAVARAAGETAPLLFTALGSRLVNVGDYAKPMDALPIFIYTNARQPYAELNQQAWGAALLLLLLVLITNLVARRIASRSPSRRGQ
jgi:phosphate transport system permease protein